MNDLKFSVSQASDGTVKVDVSVSASDLCPGEGTALGEGAVSIVGALRVAGAQFLFAGKIVYVVNGSCDRCLQHCAVPVEIDVMWYLEHGPRTAGRLDGEICVSSGDDTGEETRHYFEGNEIDLAAPLREEILLGAPAKFLCREDCRGLCPKCGAQLNDGPCTCSRQPNTGHAGFAALAEMFPELDGETVED